MLSQFTHPETEDSDQLEEMPFDKSVAPKVDRARLLRTVLSEGCPLEERSDGEDGLSSAPSGSNEKGAW